MSLIKLPPRIPDHYGALEVKPTASEAVIRWAWRREAVKLSRSQALGHPDAADRMSRVNAAAKVLLDQQQRAVYDQQLRESQEGGARR